MTDSQSINLSISAEQLEAFCQSLISESRDITKAHAALIALNSFITLHSNGCQQTEQYSSVVSAIKSVIASSHQSVLEKNTKDLLKAFKQCNVIALTMVHNSLPRNDFYQLMQSVIDSLSDDDIRLLMVWSANWVRDARELLGDSGGVVFDLSKFEEAGLSREEFNSMGDVDRVLNL